MTADPNNPEGNDPIQANTTQDPNPQPKLSTWGEAAGAGAFGGAIAGLIGSYGGGKLGFGAFVVFMFVMMGINGGSRKALAVVIFPVVAALVAVLFKK